MKKTRLLSVLACFLGLSHLFFSFNFLGNNALAAELPAHSLSEPVELVFWNYWDSKLILPVIEAFEAENPGIKIKNEQLSWSNGFDKLVISMANNKTPDICELGSTWMGKFMSEGALMDITDQVLPLKGQYLMWEPTMYEGRHYGMPWLAGTRVLFYNKALFREAGLDPASPPTTWAELLEAAKAIHNPRKGIYGFGMNAGEGHILYKKFMPLAWGNGGKILDEHGEFQFDSPEVRETLDFYLKLKDYSYCEKQDLLDEAFKRGKLGLAISGSWNFSRYPIEAPQLNFGVCLMPKPSAHSGFSTSFLGGQVLALFKSCKAPTAAARFIKFLATYENTMPITKEAWVSFPAHLKAYSDPIFTQNPRLQVFVLQMQTAIHPPIHPLWIELEKIINQAVEKAMYNEPVDEVFIEARTEFTRLTARAKGAGHSSSLLIVLLSAIGVGVLVNAILLSFLLFEVKRGRLPTAALLRSQRYILFLLPWLATFAVFWLYPLLFSLVLSFSDYNVFQPQSFTFMGLDNYLRLFKDESFYQAFANTLLFVAGTTPVTTALGLALAIMLTQIKRFTHVLRSIFFLPSIVSIVVTATIFKTFYAPLGLLNKFLEFFGISGQGWLVDRFFALPAIMAMDIWAYSGYYMVLFIAALAAIPKAIYEAAEVDGATNWTKFRYITLPQLRYMIVFVVTINTIRSWQVFPEIFTLTSGGPMGSTNTLLHHLYEQAFRYHEMGYSSAMAFVLLLLVLTVSLFQMRLLSSKKEAIYERK